MSVRTEQKLVFPWSWFCLYVLTCSKRVQVWSVLQHCTVSSAVNRLESFGKNSWAHTRLLYLPVSEVHSKEKHGPAVSPGVERR